MNWKRPIEFVKVKKHPDGIFVDKCCADMVRFIDNLPDTYTTWCCCGHEAKTGTIEFMSKLKLDCFYGHREYANTEEDYGYFVTVTCHCNLWARLKAKLHFRQGQA